MTAEPLPELQALLAAVAGGPSPAPTTPVAELRRLADAGVMGHHHWVRDHGPLHDVRDVEVAGVPCRLYVPVPEADRIHVHLHGGAWWMGSIETTDPMARELAHVTGLAVLSVNYRLAPEHPFPAGLDDVVAVLTGLDEVTLGFRPPSVSVGGESAGANLAAAACLALRGDVPLVAQWLDVPCVDLTCPDDGSMRAYGTGNGLEVAQLQVLRAWYGGDLTDPLVSPAFSEDLSGLPPALVTTAECDPLRDQGERYAEALAAAGNDVVYRCNPRQIHASSWFTALTPANATWYDETVAHLTARHAALAGAR
jgi:acetyl esterase